MTLNISVIIIIYVHVDCVGLACAFGDVTRKPIKNHYLFKVGKRAYIFTCTYIYKYKYIYENRVFNNDRLLNNSHVLYIEYLGIVY